MVYIIIAVISFFVAGLTFFSGFGLGTLLMPVFAVFFPVEIAVAATAVVHLANNLFKVVIVGKKAHIKTVFLFGVPAALSAIAGAYFLTNLSLHEPIYIYRLGAHSYSIEIIKIIIAVLMIAFAFIEISKRFEKKSVSPKYIPVGGVLSGFFGGLSGHQGAFRSAFLIKSGLTKEQFIGTSVVTAVIVDVVRLLIYGLTIFSKHIFIFSEKNLRIAILTGIIAAFIGSYAGSKTIEKVTLRNIQIFVAVMLVILAIALAAGLV